MLKTIFCEEFDDSKTSKIRFLKKHKIALFDVVTSSDLSGSADSDLAKSNIRTANFDFLLPPHTKLEKIICNGKTAYNLFKKFAITTVPVICLPSTSSANPRFDLRLWQKELSFLINF